jgi:hypothetical protein
LYLEFLSDVFLNWRKFAKKREIQNSKIKESSDVEGFQSPEVRGKI